MVDQRCCKEPERDRCAWWDCSTLAAARCIVVCLGSGKKVERIVGLPLAFALVEHQLHWVAEDKQRVVEKGSKQRVVEQGSKQQVVEQGSKSWWLPFCTGSELCEQ